MLQYKFINIYNFTDLAEVVSVTPAQPMPGPPKKTDDKSFFDVNVSFCIIYYIFKNEISIICLYICSFVQTDEHITFVLATQQLRKNGLRKSKRAYNSLIITLI